jgi:hypothetical protein
MLLNYEEGTMKRLTIFTLLLCASLWMWAQQAGTVKESKGPNAGHKPQAAADMGAFSPDKLQWGPAPDVLAAGAQLAVVEGDPTKPGSYTMRLKMPAGYKIAPHHHARREHVTVRLSSAFLRATEDLCSQPVIHSIAALA